MRWTKYGSYEFPDFDEGDIDQLLHEIQILKQENEDLKRQRNLLIAELTERCKAFQTNNH